ncbi:NYN domain-containing protein [Psychroserpens sp. Hel_I_66]|uniref:NYN domain-containing protein n=1 Tax=Psychroserpens sp. Hel_I_66 TaxID=1250004 RepID=UPI0006919192|nr:NYN domain-containing protein [Psychroserpens sp. Hel_I_66]
MGRISNVAILIDGGFYKQRFKKKHGKYPSKYNVKTLITDIINQIKKKSGEDSEDILFRSYYYDCLPFDKVIKHPDGSQIDFGESKLFNSQTKFINSLTEIDQMALRLGELSFNGWRLSPYHPKGDPSPDFRQKGVDMKIGLDMAWMASRDTIHKIVLVAGDSDFVSPMKLVRREGILIYIYPMGNKIKAEFKEHSDFILNDSDMTKKNKKNSAKNNRRLKIEGTLDDVLKVSTQKNEKETIKDDKAN